MEASKDFVLKPPTHYLPDGAGFREILAETSPQEFELPEHLKDLPTALECVSLEQMIVACGRVFYNRIFTVEEIEVAKAKLHL